MSADAIQTANVAGTTHADLSLIGLILHADPIVMAVVFGLVVMSILSWGIIIEKVMAFRTIRERLNAFEHDFWSADALDKFHERVKKRKAKHPIANVFMAAMDEWFRSKNADKHVLSSEFKVNMKDRIAQMMSVTRNRELDRMERGLGFLATAGSSAPFIGLFGTVIGIMNSFRAIAGTNNTSLAVVAPGIAEALFATAIGLFVAIPAVIAYNRFSNDLARIASRLDDFSTEFHTLLSRQMDQGSL